MTKHCLLWRGICSTTEIHESCEGVYGVCLRWTSGGYECGGGVANANLKHCVVNTTEAALKLDESRHPRLREGSGAGVRDVWDCCWQSEFMKSGPLHCALLYAAGR